MYSKKEEKRIRNMRTISRNLRYHFSEYIREAALGYTLSCGIHPFVRKQVAGLVGYTFFEIENIRTQLPYEFENLLKV